MRQIRRSGIVAATVIGVAAWAALAAGEAVWVTRDGGETKIEAHAHATFVGEGATEFDVASLADGESRVLGEGPKQIRATRRGDEVTIERVAPGDEGELRVTCQLPQDTCTVITFQDQPEKVQLMVLKERHCADGAGDCGADLDLLPGGADGKRIVVREIECDGPGACADAVAGAGAEVRVIHAGDPEKLFVVEAGGGLVLRCPEGDTTMRIERKDAESTFLCPKHSVALEKVEPDTKHQRIRVVAEPRSH